MAAVVAILRVFETRKHKGALNMKLRIAILVLFLSVLLQNASQAGQLAQEAPEIPGGFAPFIMLVFLGMVYWIKSFFGKK